MPANGVDELRRAQEIATAVNAELVLEAVLPCQDYAVEVRTVAEQARQAGAIFSAVSFSPADYLQSIMPGTSWPDVPELSAIYDSVREAFPGVLLGGGMHAFFPELNRHRPPVDHLDYITHTSNTITHACDDITVTENLEALPYVIKTCRSFAGGQPYRVGPSAIAMRFNPYGSKTMDNPNNQRIAMARMDPRQRGLVNSAWTIGYVAHMARGDVEVVALQAAVGEFGLIYYPQDWPQPWFDEAQAEVYPAFHPVQGLAAAAGAEKLSVASTNSHDVEAVAYRREDETVLWLANLTGQSKTLTVSGLPSGIIRICRLDGETFEACVSATEGFDNTGTTVADPLPALSLAPYAALRITVA